MFMEALIFLAILVLFVFMKVRKGIFKKQKYLQGIPGPKPVPIFGNSLDFLTSPSKFLSKLMEYIEKYGEITIVHARLCEVLVIVTDYKLTEYVLSSAKILQKPPMYQFLHNWLGMGLLTSTGTKWKTHRKLLTPSFHFSILINFIKTFESVGDKFIERLKKEVGKPSLEIYHIVSLCTLDIICETAMGTSVNALSCGESEYVESVKAMCTIVGERVFSIVDKRFYWLTPNYFKEKKKLKVLHSFAEKVIEEKIKNRNTKTTNAVNDEDFTKNRKMAFLDLLLDITIDGKPLTRTELREEVDSFMFGGHDTISSALTFALHSLAANPDIQQKVVDEQRKIFGNDVTAKVTMTDLQDMKYLELVIKETLRLYPSVPLIGRELTEDLEWGDTVFPKGQSIGIFIFGIQRNAKYFPDPEKFIPERFENYKGKHPFRYIPFSAGPRNCLGQKFAMLEMKTLLSKVVRNFELHPSKPAHVLELAPEIVLVPKNGVCISLRKREWVQN